MAAARPADPNDRTVPDRPPVRSYLSGLACSMCGHVVEVDHLQNTCPSCNRVLTYRYDLDAVREAFGFIIEHKDEIALGMKVFAGAALGDEAVLIGSQGADRITADDIATWTGTIAYEVLCTIGPRIPRHYHAS